MVQALNCKGVHGFLLGLSCSSDGKEYAHNVGVLGSIFGSGRSPGEGNGNPLQNSCLENSKEHLGLISFRYLPLIIVERKK